MSRLPNHVGRIRLNENEARYLYWLLEDERLALLIERKEAQKAGENIHSYQREIAHVRNVRNEVSLLMQQKGWSIGQHEQSDEEDSDPGVPTGK